MRRQQYPETGALPDLALDFDLASVLIHYLLDDRQAEPCTLCARRHKGPEDTLQIGRGNTLADIMELKCKQPRRPIELRNDSYRPACGHGLRCVHHDIAHHLSQQDSVTGQ